MAKRRIRVFVCRVGVPVAATVLGAAPAGATLSVLYETNADIHTAGEVYVTDYASIDDFLGGSNFIASRTGQINVSAEYSIGGIFYDQGLYRVLYETNADINTAGEVYVSDYASIDDFLGGTKFVASRTGQINISPDYSIGGIFYDEGLYHVVYETNADINTAGEVYVTDYASIDDFLGGSKFVASRTGQINLSPGYNIHGIFVETPSVPEPATWLMMMLGFGAVGAAMRRGKAVLSFKGSDYACMT